MNSSSDILPTIADLAGLWRRSLIAWPDGRRDTETWVGWLQGKARYIDLRQPADKPDFSGVKGLRGLDDELVRWMARQEGFAGIFVFDGTHFEWRREIDIQPKRVYSDVGSLRYEADYLVEEGRDVSYIEHWHRDEPPAGPMAAMTMTDKGGGQAALMRVGPLFMYARARAFSLPDHVGLASLVAAAPDLAAAQDLVNVEISFGRVTAEGWRIARSSLPFRENGLLAPHLGGGWIELDDLDGDGEAFRRRWSIVVREGDLGAAFP